MQRRTSRKPLILLSLLLVAFAVDASAGAKCAPETCPSKP
jgi:hypothetical protein